MRSRRSLVTFALSLSVVLMPLPDRAARAETVVQGAEGKRLDSICKSFAEHGFSGTVLIARGEKTLLQKGYGLADRAANTENAPDTVFEIASLSKQFTAAAILALEEDGKLSTDDLVKKHLSFLPEPYTAVTIYQLLTHTAGTPAGGAGRGLDASTAIPEHLKDEPLSPPGQAYRYSNVGYAILAAVVEAASGQSLEDYCRERLFTRAGLTSTSFCGTPLSNVPSALGYSQRAAEPRSPWVDPYPPADEFGYEYRGMGGVVSNVLDLNRWIRALQTDAVLTNASRQKLFTPHLNRYACGWEIFEFDDSIRCISHGGAVQGYACKLWWFPDEGALLIVLANNDAFDYTMLNSLRQGLFTDVSALAASDPAEPPPPAAESPPVNSADLQADAGTYTWNVLPEIKLELTAQDAGLQAQLTVPPDLPDTPEHPQTVQALRIITAISKGNPARLANAMDPSIPDSWPELVVNDLFPAQVDRCGAFKSARAIAHGPVPGYPTDWRAVWLNLEYERSSRLAMIGFRPTGRLQLLIWDVPELMHLDGALYRPTGAHTYQCDDPDNQVTLTTAGGKAVAKNYVLKLEFNP